MGLGLLRLSYEAKGGATAAVDAVPRLAPTTAVALRSSAWGSRPALAPRPGRSCAAVEPVEAMALAKEGVLALVPLARGGSEARHSE
jgi:hypothetical protein